MSSDKARKRASLPPKTTAATLSPRTPTTAPASDVERELAEVRSRVPVRQPSSDSHIHQLQAELKEHRKELAAALRRATALEASCARLANAIVRPP